MERLSYRPRGSEPDDPRLGRLVPDDWEHVEKYPARAALRSTVETVEKTLLLPRWHWTHDQGREGSCVGHGCALERAITNTAQNRLARLWRPGRRYDPLHIWNEAKKIDEWPETNPGDENGTSVRAAYDVLRDQGARVIAAGGLGVSPATGDVNVHDLRNSPQIAEGIHTNRWATTVDEMRTALAAKIPIVIGVNWYGAFDGPEAKRGAFGRVEHWIAAGGVGSLGRIRGGHCVCVYGASDKRQAFRVKNSWGRSYPLVWLPYVVMQRLIDEWGEAALVIDR